MRVYRVELLDGRGPWEGTPAGWMGHTCDQLGLAHYHEQFPTPPNDGIPVDEDYWSSTSPFFCGCLSLAQIDKWFPRCLREALARFYTGFILGEYEVPEASVRISGSQVCFDTRAATRVSILDLINLQPKENCHG